MKAESRRQRRIRAVLEKEVGGYWRKIWGGPYQHRGLPDLIGCVDGLFFAFEIKEPNGKPSDLQLYEIDQIYKSGGCAAVVIEPETAVELVRQTVARAKSLRGLQLDPIVRLPVLQTKNGKNVHNYGGPRKARVAKRSRGGAVNNC